IPTASDVPPPLVLSLRSVAAEAAAAKTARQATQSEKRKKKSRKSEEHGWDRALGGTPLPASDDKRQMFWWFIGGATLFGVIMAMVLMAMLREVKGKADLASQPPTPSAPAAPPPVKDPTTDAERSDAAFLTKAEALAKKFMEAISIEELLPLVRNPNVAEGRMKKFYPDGKVTAPGMSSFNTTTRVFRTGSIIGVMVRNKDFVGKPLYFFESPSGIKIDWESWVGWSEVSWDDLVVTKPRTPKLFRVTLSAVQYYNFFFADEQRWQSYRIESPDRKHSVYGYVERNSPLDARLRLPVGMKQASLTLALRFPEDALSSNQVIIDGFVSEGWVLETEPTP
ncbi:MAG: hypothetical protein WCS43_05275, partial [Verrucomicrobiota bacterium]